jgi:ABC-type bacteriocin/lantibiotic exporter with double-glycine peptidase domain
MPLPIRSSGRRYRDYRAKLKQRRRQKDAAAAAAAHGDAIVPGPPPSPEDKKKHYKRSRSFTTLLAQFWGLLRGYRGLLVSSLLVIGISQLLGLIPLYGTKIVFDSVLRDQPLPPRLPHWIRVPHDRRHVLAWVAIGMVLIALGSEVFGLWSRWQATRTTKRVQVRSACASASSTTPCACRCTACTTSRAAASRRSCAKTPAAWPT